jgi:hypothetical protein
MDVLDVMLGLGVYVNLDNKARVMSVSYVKPMQSGD